MFKSFTKLILGLSVLAIFSCVKGSNVLPEPTEGGPEGSKSEEEQLTEPGPVVPWDDNPTTFKIVLTFNGTPTEIRFADLKYNKIGVLSMDWDDGSNTSMDAMALFKDLTIPDGTGKEIPWRGGVAVIGRSAYNDNELGLMKDLSSVNYEQMQTLIANGWDIENHGLYSGFGGIHESNSAFEDIEELDKLIRSRIGYKMAVTVVPGMENGYVEAAADLGHLAATSQRNDVGGVYVPQPEAEWKPLTDIHTWEPGFKYLTRSFTDGWDSNVIVEKTTELLSKSSGAARKLLRIGTHDSSPEGFAKLVTQLHAAMAGDYLVCSLRELMEYEKFKSESVLTVNGESITVQAPAGLRWEDFTLVIEGAAVVSATCDQADDVTFSGNMVNVYKDR